MLTVPLIAFLSAQSVASQAAAAADSVEQSASQPAPIGPPAPPKRKPKPVVDADSGTCKTALPTEPGEIVVCAVKPQGYRIDPDILQAGREKRNRRRPKPPDRMADKSCQVVGPMGCRGEATVNVVQATLAAATMLKKAVNGENVGKMFVTRPEPSEYELYLEAKRGRQAREEEEAAMAAASEVRSSASSENAD